MDVDVPVHARLRRMWLTLPPLRSDEVGEPAVSLELTR